MHFRCTILGPISLYSSAVIHVSANVDNEANMDPPIQTENRLSGGATIFTYKMNESIYREICL